MNDLDYRTAFELAPIGLVMSRNRQMVDCNRQLLTMFGAAREQQRCAKPACRACWMGALGVVTNNTPPPPPAAHQERRAHMHTARSQAGCRAQPGGRCEEAVGGWGAHLR